MFTIYRNINTPPSSRDRSLRANADRLHRLAERQRRMQEEVAALSDAIEVLCASAVATVPQQHDD
jgi:hypothetical protein